MWSRLVLLRSSIQVLMHLLLQVVVVTTFSFQANAGILDTAKSWAYRNPSFLRIAIRESLTARCNRYLGLASGVKNQFVMDCFNASTELFKILDLTSIEAEPKKFYPISFHTSLGQMARDRNVITFLDFFNKNVSEHEIEFLQNKIQEFFADRYTFWHFIAVLFQDSTETQLVYLKNTGLDTRSLNILTTANRKFYQALTKIENTKCLIGAPPRSALNPAITVDQGLERTQRTSGTVETKICDFDQTESFADHVKRPLENAYHFFVVRYLAQELNKKFSYGLSAFVGFLFNYTYELFSEEMKFKYILNDPDSYPEKETEDVLSGLAGAYYLENVYDEEEKYRAILVNSPQKLLLELAQKAIPSR